MEKPSTPETLLYARLYPNPTCARRVCGDEQQEHRDTHGWNIEKVTRWFHWIVKKEVKKKKKRSQTFLKSFVRPLQGRAWSKMTNYSLAKQEVGGSVRILPYVFKLYLFISYWVWEIWITELLWRYLERLEIKYKFNSKLNWLRLPLISWLKEAGRRLAGCGSFSTVQKSRATPHFFIFC